MHRSRVGYDAMANRQIREKQILQKREEHLTKIAKIMTRKPGEGNLDNHAVVIVQSQHTARRQGVQQHKNAIVERENKNLLRRISTILTAAPKNSVESYNQMKALRASSKGGGPKVQFEKEIQQKRLNQFFVSVSKTGAYYNPDHWEKDYQKQLLRHKFLRQVNYERPKDFIDPFQIPEVEEKSHRLSRAEIFKMYSHMSRSQHPQKSTSRSSSPETSQGSPQMEGGKFPYSNSRFVSGLRSEGKEQESLEDNYDTDGWHNEYNEDFECALDEEGEGGDYGEGMEALGDSIKHLLHVRRVTTMTLDEDSVTIAVPMDIRCLLVEGSTLVIIAMEEVDESKEREGGAGNKKRQGKGSSSWGVHAGVQAEAEIGLQELLELREGAGSVVSTDVVNVMLQGDYSYLKTLAAELMNTIEIRIEGGEARLVLSLEKKKSFTASRRPSIAI